MPARGMRVFVAEVGGNKKADRGLRPGLYMQADPGTLASVGISLFFCVPAHRQQKGVAIAKITSRMSQHGYKKTLSQISKRDSVEGLT